MTQVILQKLFSTLSSNIVLSSGMYQGHISGEMERSTPSPWVYIVILILKVFDTSYIQIIYQTGSYITIFTVKLKLNKITFLLNYRFLVKFKLNKHIF